MKQIQFKSLDIPKLDSDPLQPWLHHQASLTDKLQSLLPNVALKRISQQWVTASWWARYGLGLETEPLFQREIIMYGQNLAYWYARTLIPQSCFELNPNFFKRLERESLRNLLFDGHEVHRIARKVYLVDPSCIEYHWVKKYLSIVETRLWVRYTEYSYQYLKSFYLLELLLPRLGELGA